MFDSQEHRQDRPQGLKKKKETFKNQGLVAAQCNGIAACAYSLKKYLQYGTYTTICTWSVVLRPLFTFLLDKWAPNNPVYVHT